MNEKSRPERILGRAHPGGAMFNRGVAPDQVSGSGLQVPGGFADRRRSGRSVRQQHPRPAADQRDDDDRGGFVSGAGKEPPPLVVPEKGACGEGKISVAVTI